MIDRSLLIKGCYTGKIPESLDSTSASFTCYDGMLSDDPGITYEATLQPKEKAARDLLVEVKPFVPIKHRKQMFDALLLAFPGINWSTAIPHSRVELAKSKERVSVFSFEC